MQFLARKHLLWIVPTIALLLVILYGTITVNRELPDESEHELGRALATSVKEKVKLRSKQQVLFEAARGRVTLNMYGVVDSIQQEGIVDLVRQDLANRKSVSTSVRILFFSERLYQQRTGADGTVVSELVKSEPIRQIDLNEQR